MPAIGESLKQFWLRCKIELRCGASDSDLRDFENKYNIHLPDDLKDYFSTADGFYNSDVDGNFITFLPLAEVVPLNEQWSRKPEAKSYFIFADYSISAHVYAIYLTDDASSNPIVIAYDNDPKQIASSFSEFVQGYIEDDYGVLFPQ
ncbi:MAG: SMI1/KNR4 family protein [Pyrinomonadaceae bacterium]